MSHRIKAVAVVVAVVAIVGCTASHPAPARATAQVTTAAPDCTAADVVAQLVGGRGTATPATTPGVVPAGFVPVAAVECTLATGDGSADDPHTAVDERHLSGDLGGVAAAIDRASARLADECPAMGQVQPVLYLVDAEGRTVRVAWPLDRCGYIQQQALDAVEALHVDSVQTLRVG